MMSDSYANRTLTAFFDERDDAEEAVRSLRAIGVPDTSVSLLGGQQQSQSQYEEKGFWETLGDMFFPDEDRETYGEGLRRGGYLVTVRNLDAALLDRAVEILDDEGTVDLDERSARWRSEGWRAGADDTLATQKSPSSPSSGPALASGDVKAGVQGGELTRAASSETETENKAIPIVEERLRVGKRDTNLGRVRVRSYVVEEPVEEQVTLRQERVKVERRPVDQVISGRENVFQDRIIEAEEHAEDVNAD